MLCVARKGGATCTHRARPLWCFASPFVLHPACSLCLLRLHVLLAEVLGMRLLRTRDNPEYKYTLAFLGEAVQYHYVMPYTA